MQAFDKITNYCEIVCNQVRWKKAKPIIAMEIENHICDQRDAYICHGDSEENATDKAILQMGDAEQIGLSLDKTHKPKTQWTLLIFCVLFMSIGATMNFISSSIYGEASISFASYLVAAAALFMGYFLDFTILGKYPIFFFLFIATISNVMLITAVPINGVRYAMGRIPLSILALVFPIAYALFVYWQKNKGYAGILLSGIGFLPFAFVLLMAPALSGLLLYTITSLITLCFAINKGFFKVNKRNALMLVFIPTLIAVLILTVFLFSNGHYSDRIAILINPSLDPMGEGYLPIIVREVISDSAFIGSGSLPANFSTRYSILFYHSNFMLTLFISSYGFIIPFALAGILLVFVVIAFKKISSQKSHLGSLITLSIILTFFFQAISYLLYNLGYIFSTPFAFPFISSGKISLWINAMLIGFMLSVFRTGDVFRDSLLEEEYILENDDAMVNQNKKLI